MLFSDALGCGWALGTLVYNAGLLVQHDCVIEPVPPFVSSFGSHNITLRWKAANISDVRYIIQSKYVNIPGEWEYTQPITETSYTVTNLQPYTEYWFRVIWIICQLQYYSTNSPVYRTLPDGVPSTAPQIQNLDSLSCDTIEVSWLPPLFPNGLIIGYNLYLNTTDEAQKHISAAGRQDFQFYRTKAATVYRFSITAVNEQGEGPAAEANVTTAGSPDPDNSQWLFLSRNNILKKRDNLKEVLHEAQCLTAPSRISSVSANVYTQVIYFSEKNRIWIKGTANMSDNSNLGIIHTGYETITSLSVDWLYNKMFFIMSSQIYSCDLLNCTAAQKIPLQDVFKPKKIEVDPYNGYLFLLLDDGIHRMVLPESQIDSNATEHIVNSIAILDFVISVQSKRLVFLNSFSPGIFYLMSVFLDGSNGQRLREIEDASIKEIISFLYFKDSLMFTNGNIVFYEEFISDQYWYNEYLVTCDLAASPLTGFDNMNLYGKSTQPIPLPGSPEQLMVVFGPQSAEVLWKPPKLTVGASAASWQRWTYSVSISLDKLGIQKVFTNITFTRMVVANLNISTKYEITVRASSPAGDSQWTTPVEGTTLDAVEEELYFLAVGTDGLWKQPLDKFGPLEVVNKNLRFVSDLDWYNSTLYWSNETGHVHMWNISDTSEFPSLSIPGIRRAGPLSFDWIGQYIYWADKGIAKREKLHLYNLIVHYDLSTLCKPVPGSSDTLQTTRLTLLLTGNELGYGPNLSLSEPEKKLSLPAQINCTWGMSLPSSCRAGAQEEGTKGYKGRKANGQLTNLAYQIFRTTIKTFLTDVVNVGRHLVTDVTVDSINAFLYWTTDYTVESSRLNGQEHLIIQNLTLFSSTQVVALTLDFKHGWLYWLVNNGLIINLHRTNIRKDGSNEAKVTEFASWSESEISQHALMFYSDRLFWINGQKYITVQELNQSSCTPFSQPGQFIGFTLTGKNLNKLAGNFSHTPEVIPDFIPSSSFEISGNYSHFIISWKAPSNIEYGTLFFCVESTVLHQMLGESSEFCQNSGKLTYSFYTVEGLEPYTEFDFAVTPYTYWGKGNSTSLILRSPQGVPSSPQSPRIYSVGNFNLTDIKNIGVEFRWDEPERSNGVLINYNILYTLAQESEYNETVGMPITINITASTNSYNLYDLSPEILLRFKVQAYTSVGPGPFSDMAEVLISDIHPPPTLIGISSNQISFNDVDRKQVLWNLTEENIKLASYIALDGRLYFLRNDRIFLRDTKCKSSILLVADERLSGTRSMTADWIARHIYVVVHSEQNNTELFFIDLEHKEKNLKPVGTSQKFSNLAIDTITVYPLLSRLYWIEHWEMGSGISYYDSINDTIVHVLGDYIQKDVAQATGCDCHMKNWELITLMTLDTTNTSSSHILFLWNGTNIWASDIDGCQCWNVIKIPLMPGFTITSLTVDDYFIYWSVNVDEKTSIYGASKKDHMITLLQFTPEQHVQVMAYSTSLQRFPDKGCLVLASLTSIPVVLNSTTTSLTLQLPPEFQNQIALILGLQPFSDYEMEVSVTNYYSFLLAEQPRTVLVTGKTDYGVPEAVSIIEATVLSDSLANITWVEPSRPNGPLELIRYQIKVDNSAPSPSLPLRQRELPDEKLLWTFTNLKSGTDHQFKVLAFHPDENWYTESTAIYARTFKSPAPPHNIIPGNTSLVLEWTAPEEPIAEFWFEENKLKWSTWYKSMDVSCTARSIYICTVTGLVPNTSYNIRTVVVYTTGAQSVSNPANFKTAAGVPSKPGVPQIVPGDKSTVQWNMGEDNGSNLTYNMLEYREVVSGAKVIESWTLAYNGSCSNICIWKSRILDGTFQFRAASANLLGLGDYSDTSENILLQKENGSSNQVAIVVGSVLGILLVLLLVIAFVVYQKSKQNSIDKKDDINNIHEDKELAKLRGLSYAVGLGNACYAVSILPTKSEMEILPSFPRENLTLCDFLGSGAFGEVYEGTAKEILGPGTGTSKVAVKTLKSDATDNEKVDFLKEAHLMSQFHHSNILKLLGVCLFNEPQYIILELMDGGDLLSYLRGARQNTFYEDPLLSSMDLLDISLDISRGCAYLERLHFVHRDLAARNCLVSVKEYNNPTRAVKIGDFGLARDVYKSDYYRKKGEGFLPVRWMAPESLIDGIFTNRSDVWSFGVLLWELFTLGQQPYQGYSNMEVLHYVRSGRRMDPPDNCPDDIWDLILKCWMQDPVKRPSFSRIHEQLEELKGCSLRCTRPKQKSLEGIVNPGFEVPLSTLTTVRDRQKEGSIISAAVQDIRMGLTLVDPTIIFLGLSDEYMYKTCLLFPDTNVSVLGSTSEDTGSVTLTEARNVDGLNYLMVTT
ncbi:PREDICTED: proto-oncogene tyrosine-protein kinase ROS [Nanorana parkeri]|uniref:proto-oncogene tyrosine-protein kinase ROS n=1 Tax=Nanorana parkeri TaxID=125878 RepID=UPI0008547C27|nr:PREDICTED: proto-oncogene tyrosine-protein kinase ROS [Nanorana parkeri]